MYTYKEAAEYLGSKQDRPIGTGRATRIIRRGAGEIAIRYQQTDVVTYREDGTIKLDSGGWRTVTTKARINEYTRARMSSERGVWSLVHGPDYWTGKRYAYRDGMIIREDGTPVDGQDGTEDKAIMDRLNKMISKYVRGYATEVCKAELFPEPGLGDCLMCQQELARVLGKRGPIQHVGRLTVERGYEDTTGQPEAMGVDHYLSHFEEGYYVPSVYALACVARRYGGGPAIGWQMGVQGKDRGWILRDLGYYFRQPKLRQALAEELKRQQGAGGVR